MLAKGHLGDRLDTSFDTGNTYLIIFFFLLLFLNSPFSSSCFLSTPSLLAIPM